MIKSIILNNSSIYIEGYNNIEYFNEQSFKINSKLLTIDIEGTNLILESLGKECIKISGIITSIKYIKYGDVYEKSDK